MIENEKIEEMMLELEDASERAIDSLEEIGRASCRERV